MIDEFGLALALKFPTDKMSGLSIKRHMRKIATKAGITPYKLNRDTWLVSEETIPVIREYLCHLSPNKEKIPRAGGYAAQLRGHRSLKVPEYLTPVENARP